MLVFFVCLFQCLFVLFIYLNRGEERDILFSSKLIKKFSDSNFNLFSENKRTQNSILFEDKNKNKYSEVYTINF